MLISFPEKKKNVGGKRERLWEESLIFAPDFGGKKYIYSMIINQLNQISNLNCFSMKKLLTLFVALIATVSLMAQVTSSSISGKITDQRKGVLPGATVVATHTPSGAQYYAVADANGNYRLLNIRPGGPYKVEYRMVGFQTVIQEGITATLGETKILNVRMNEESIGLGEVVVAAEAISNGMDSDRAGATTTVSTEQITALPTITRSLNDVMALTPQAAATSNGLAIGGGNYRSSVLPSTTPSVSAATCLLAAAPSRWTPSKP